MLTSFAAAVVINLLSVAGVRGDDGRQDLCASVKAAIDAAPGQFASLKGPPDRYEPSFFVTSWRVPGATEDDCFVNHDEDAGYDMSCSVRVASLAAARQKAQEWAEGVERCLAVRGQFVAREWRENSSSTRLSTGQHISREFFVPTDQPAYDVRVRVGGYCSTSRRGERCSASLLVDLVGDER